MAILDQLRTAVMIRIGLALDRALREPVFNAVIEQQLLRRTIGDGQQPVRDLDTVRTFLGGPGLTAFFDLPWMPLYIVICFLLHPLLGALADRRRSHPGRRDGIGILRLRRPEQGGDRPRLPPQRLDRGRTPQC